MLKVGLMDPKVLGVNIKTLMLSGSWRYAFQHGKPAEKQNASDKYDDVLKEIPKVRKKTLVSLRWLLLLLQIVGTQAVFNVLMGERYKMATDQTKDLLSGKYGRTVKPFNPEVQKKVIGDREVITCRPADLIRTNWRRSNPR